MISAAAILLAMFTGGASVESASAQTPTISAGLPSSPQISDAPAREQAAHPLGPADYPTFSHWLTDSLQSRGLDPAHRAHHFVALLDTSVTDEAAPAQARTLLTYFFRQYLASCPTASDKVSLVLYQLDVCDARYNLLKSNPSTDAMLQNLLEEVKNGPFPQPENGGHDNERSLLTARDHVEQPENAIYLLLSRSDKSYPPVNSPTYRLAGAHSLDALHLDVIPGVFAASGGRELLHAWLYIPQQGVSGLGVINPPREPLRDPTAIAETASPNVSNVTNPDAESVGPGFVFGLFAIAALVVAATWYFSPERLRVSNKDVDLRPGDSRHINISSDGTIAADKQPATFSLAVLARGWDRKLTLTSAKGCRFTDNTSGPKSVTIAPHNPTGRAVTFAVIDREGKSHDVVIQRRGGNPGGKSSRPSKTDSGERPNPSARPTGPVIGTRPRL